MQPRFTLPCALALLTTVATFADPATKPSTQPAATQSAPITHIVVCWLRTHGDNDARQKLVDASKSMKQIPGIQNITVGVPLPSTRPSNVSDYDLAVVITFADAQALADYAKNPLHQKLVAEVLKPLVREYKVYDVENR